MIHEKKNVSGGELDSQQFSALLLAQENDWKKGRRLVVESILTEVNESVSDDQIMSLVCNEVYLRESIGELPQLKEYQLRFPHLAEDLSIQWQIDGLLFIPPDIDSDATIVGKGDETISGSGKGPWVDERYVIQEQVGAGGMGVVHKALDTRLQRIVAIKQLKLASLDTNDDRLLRFRREAEVIAKIKHPNIVPIFDRGDSIDGPYIAMEFCASGSLADVLRDGVLPPKLAAEIARQIAEGVAAAHQEKIVHRDLKPANILFSSRAMHKGSKPSIKISDFGLAKRIDGSDDQTRTGELLGTPAYLAPEQLLGGATAQTHLVDVYALGTILYESLSGRPPIRGATPLETLKLLASQEPVPLRNLQPNVPVDLATITHKCLQRQTEHRYQSARAVAIDLSHFLEGRPILARPTPLFVRAWKWCKRSPKATYTILAISIGAVVALAMWVSFTRELGLARDRALAERIRADSQRDAAISARNRTNEVLDAMTSNLAETFLIQQESITTEQKRFFQTILDYYQAALDEDGTEDSAAYRAASILNRVASIQFSLGNLSDCITSYQLAAKKLEFLLERSSDNPDYLRMFASVSSNLGLHINRIGLRDDALQAYMSAEQSFQKLVELNPDDYEQQVALVRVQYNSGLLLRDKALYDEFEKRMRQTLESFERIDREFTKEQNHLALLGCNYTNLGTHVAPVRLLESKLLMRKGIETFERLLEMNPLDASSQNGLAWALRNCSYVYANNGEKPLAVEMAQRSVDLLRGLVREHPGSYNFRLELASAISALALHLSSIGKKQESEELYLESLKIIARLMEIQQDRFDAYFDYGIVNFDLAVVLIETDRLELAKAKFPIAAEVWTKLLELTGESKLYQERYVAMANWMAYASGIDDTRSHDYFALAERIARRMTSLSDADPLPSKSIVNLYYKQVEASVKIKKTPSALDSIWQLLPNYAWKNDEYYDLACCYSLTASLGNDLQKECQDRSIELLGKAVDSGWKKAKHALQDPDLESLRDCAEFRVLIERMEGQ